MYSGVVSARRMRSFMTSASTKRVGAREWLHFSLPSTEGLTTDSELASERGEGECGEGEIEVEEKWIRLVDARGPGQVAEGCGGVMPTEAHASQAACGATLDLGPDIHASFLADDGRSSACLDADQASSEGRGVSWPCLHAAQRSKKPDIVSVISRCRAVQDSRLCCVSSSQLPISGGGGAGHELGGGSAGRGDEGAPPRGLPTRLTSSCNRASMVLKSLQR